MMDIFDPPEPPWENVCKHGTYTMSYCEECDDDEATHADTIIKERKEESD